MNNISVRKMRVYLAAVQEGSFTRASIKQNISQPAATIIINQIEETIGFELFDRRGATRKATLTPTGQMVAETFSRVVAAYDSELSMIGEFSSGKRGSRTILIQSGLSDLLADEFLAALLSMFPDESIRLESVGRAEVLERTTGRDVALGIADGEVDEDRFDLLQVGSYTYTMLTPLTGVGTGPALLLSGTLDRTVKRARNNMLTVLGNDTSVLEVSGLGLLAAMMRMSETVAVLPDAAISNLALMVSLQHNAAVHVPGTETPVNLLTPRGFMTRLKVVSVRGIPPFRKMPSDQE